MSTEFLQRRFATPSDPDRLIQIRNVLENVREENPAYWSAGGRSLDEVNYFVHRLLVDMEFLVNYIDQRREDDAA